MWNLHSQAFVQLLQCCVAAEGESLEAVALSTPAHKFPEATKKGSVKHSHCTQHTSAKQSGL
jgi:hypothetical protein